MLQKWNPNVICELNVLNQETTITFCYLKAKKSSSPQEPAHAGFGGLFRKLSKRDKERAARQESELSTASGHRLVSI